MSVVVCAGCSSSVSEGGLELHLRRELRYFPWECGLCACRFFLQAQARNHFAGLFPSHPGQPELLLENSDGRQEQRLAELLQASLSSPPPPRDSLTDTPLQSHGETSLIEESAESLLSNESKNDSYTLDVDMEEMEELSITPLGDDEAQHAELDKSVSVAALEPPRPSPPKKTRRRKRHEAAPAASFVPLWKRKTACRACLVLVDRDHFSGHAYTHHTDVVPFSCLSCNYASRIRQNMQTHVKTAHELEPTELNYASTWGEHEAEISQKWKTRKLSTRLQCSICQVTMSVLQRKNHVVKEHLRETIFACRQCPFKSQSWTPVRVEKHARQAHPELPPKEVYEDRRDRLRVRFETLFDEAFAVLPRHIAVSPVKEDFSHSPWSSSTGFGELAEKTEPKQATVPTDAAATSYADMEGLSDVEQLSFVESTKDAQMESTRLDDDDSLNETNADTTAAVPSWKRRYVCRICRALVRKDMFTNHAFMYHTDLVPFSCRSCTYVTRARINVVSHVKNTHSLEPTEHNYTSTWEECQPGISQKVLECFGVRPWPTRKLNTRLQCSLCSVTMSVSQRKDHVVQVHLKEASFVCRHCPYTTHSWATGRINAHAARTHPELPLKATFEDRRELLRERFESVFEDAFAINPCQVPGRRSRPEVKVEKAAREPGEPWAPHPDEPKEACRRCSRVVRRAHFRQHAYNHLDAKPFACNYCDLTCKFKQDIQRHARTHHSAVDFRSDMESVQADIRASYEECFPATRDNSRRR